LRPLRYSQSQYIAPSEGKLPETDHKGTMQHARIPLRRFLTLLSFALLCFASSAHADEYADVSQLLRAGKFAEAANKADQFLATKPKDAQMRFLKGVIQRDSGKTNEAITSFTRLTEDYPELPEPYNNLAVLYASQNQFDKARTALETAIRTNPSYATAHENLGDVYAKLASQAYVKALQLDTSNQAVPPKLALIRELFNPGARGQRPAASTPTLANVPPLGSSTSTAAAAPKPPPTLPTAPSPAISKPAPVQQPAAVVAVAPVATPATPAATPAAQVVPATQNNAAKDVESAVKTWAADWSSKNVRGYLASYGKDFAPGAGQQRAAWEESRRQRILGKSRISVKVENLVVKVDGNKATAVFRQDYKADGLAVATRKTMELAKAGDRWVIVRESTGN